MKNIFLLFLIFLIGLQSSLFSQTKFTPEPEKFLKDVQSFIGDFDKTRARKYVKSFEPLSFVEFFDANNKTHIYATLNTMVSKNLRVSPHFLSYFNAILYCSQNEMSKEKFENWQNVLDILLKKANSKRIEQFLKVSENLFLDGTIYLTSRSQKAETRWEVAR